MLGFGEYNVDDLTTGTLYFKADSKEEKKAKGMQSTTPQVVQKQTTREDENHGYDSHSIKCNVDNKVGDDTFYRTAVFFTGNSLRPQARYSNLPVVCQGISGSIYAMRELLLVN